MLMQHVPNVSSLLARTTDRARAIARAVIDCGVTPELPADLVKPTRLSNNISLVAFSMMLAWLLFEASAGYSAALPWELLWASAFAACPFLNALGQYRTARATLMVVANATVFAGDVIFEPGSGGSLPFIAMVALPLLLSRSGEKALLAIGVVVPVTLFVLCESNALVGALSIEQVPAPSWYFAANALTAFTCAFLLPLFFYQSNRRAELELERREKAKLERLIQSSIIGVARGRIGGPILEANDALLDLLGYSRDELRAGELHLERMTPVEYREVTRRAMATLAKQGVCPAYEKQYVRKDGTRVPVLVGMASMDAEGDTIGFVLDISAQKTAEEQRVLLRQNQETMRMRDLFDSVVSHELKTPLAAVTLQIELGLRALDKNNCDAAKRHLQRCGLSARKLGALVDSLLDSARIHHGKLALSPCEVDLAEMAKTVVSGLEGGGLCPPGLIHVVAPAPVVGRWDPVRMDEVLTNLCSNAVKYGAGAPIEVRVGGEDGHDDRARIEVVDHGIGIDGSMLPKIFAPFQRAHAAENVKGLGLGLHIVRSIVEGHGGTIGVESQRGQGSRFVIDLPRTPAI